ncbi:MAG: exodeoxyribonuclease V subunit alpha [Rubrivivax sp.]|nr:MAG: exodeoxyribonuclease V subunit alpha [Rubrivivax sp.]
MSSPALNHRTATLPELLALLDSWAERGWLRTLDSALAAFLAREAPGAHPLLILAAALASHQLGRGHVCLDLAATLQDASFALSLPPEGDGLDNPPLLPGFFLAGLDLPQWLAALQHPLLIGTGPGATPLVLIGPRLYLRRYWQYERDVRSGIDQRLARSPALAQALPHEALRRALDVLFPRPAVDDLVEAARTDWQKLACALAARHAFSIVTGGPGTGKTTTVVKLLALLQALAMDPGSAGAGRPWRIRLAAPTGKAAARLNESIAGAVERLPLGGLGLEAESLRATIPTSVTTLHRLLGSRPDTRHFRHHARNPLSLDVLVIDEASMIDLEMMAAVLAALPPTARLILLGDKDQLASVEAGAVLGELCARALEGHYLPATRDWLQAITGEPMDEALVSDDGQPLDQAIAMLRHSHRFTAHSGIGQLAEAVNTGLVSRTRSVWQRGYRDLAQVHGVEDDGALRQLVVDGQAASGRRKELSPSSPQGYRHYLSVMHQRRPPADATADQMDQWAREVLAAHGEFQVLCALRRGPCGVDGLNQRIAGILAHEGLIEQHEGWYPGRPVLVTRNNYSLGLMNGDVGITLGLAGGLLRVAFAAGDGSQGIKWVLPSRLQGVETVYAMTVHKSQGSEFAHGALVLPEHLNPMLTRELVYTGITRARQWFTLAGAGPDLRVFEAAIQRRVHRASGLMAP